MMTALIVSEILQWIVIIVLGIAGLALARQVGVLHVRVAPGGGARCRLGAGSCANAAKPDCSPEAKTAFACTAQTKDDTKCDYWRYCAIDGFLCSCRGSGVGSCPPGSQASPVSWVGTCINPDKYNCDNTDRETQLYVPQLNNDVIWCFATKSM